MRKLILAIGLLIINYLGFGQEMEVLSFKETPEKMQLLVDNPVFDQNGDVCALIRVITDKTGFYFDGGMTGITKTVNKEGEIWVYVPQKSKKITIMHQDYGIIRNFIFPESTKEAMVYTMILRTPIIESEKSSIQRAKIVFSSNPDGALVSINDSAWGITPITVDTLLNSELNYTIKFKKYAPYSGRELLNKPIINKHIDFKAQYYNKKYFASALLLGQMPAGGDYFDNSTALYGIIVGKLGKTGWFSCLSKTTKDGVFENTDYTSGPILDKKFNISAGVTQQLKKNIFFLGGLGISHREFEMPDNYNGSEYGDPITTKLSFTGGMLFRIFKHGLFGVHIAYSNSYSTLGISAGFNF